MKRLYIALVVMMALPMVCFVLVWAEGQYTVSGEMRNLGEAKTYVCLFNQASYRAFIGPKREMPPSGFKKMVKADKSGSAPFAFTNVPKGDYVLFAFADENNNGNFDRDSYGANLERCCSYNTTEIGWWSWHDQKFEVAKDTTGLVLNLSE
jgi:uncharacterized protein (DUF2141 family)